MNRHRLLGYAMSLAACLLIWKIASLVLNSVILPGPEQTMRAFWAALGTSLFWSHFIISTFRVLASIALAWVLAFPLGIMIGYNRKTDRLVSPLIFLTYPIPKMVFLPVIILLFGLGDLSKILLITLVVFFQILVATKEGVSGLDRKYIDSMRSMGASERDIIKDVVIPAALPSCFTALRIVTGTSISVLFFAESFAGSSGLGYMIMSAWNWGQYDQIYVGIVAMSLLGISIYEVFTYLERRCCRWTVAEEETPKGRLWEKIVTYAHMIKISHTVFALPFGLAALVVLSEDHAIGAETILWVIVAIVGARSAAMGFNRVIDASYDRKNPRTADRHIPSGALSVREATIFGILSAAVFVGAAAMLSPLCFLLSFPVLVILIGYSYTKRFTSASHLVLGISIGLMPLGASVAVSGTITPAIAVLSLALTTYIAGFDILYACQDIDFDRQAGLRSIPSRMGVTPALLISAGLHVVSLISLASLYWLLSLSLAYLFGVAVIAGLFVVEHLLVRPSDLSKINVAFFDVNSVISIMVFVAVALGAFLI
ncbi:MAG: UbiA-like polyprenyltransferase [Methanomassiliicoccus sp.]|nr:UbiA-like polyprenyltransferase [Methanomassiliicoccus sp.]